MNDKTPLRELKGVGDKTEKLFQKIGITTTEELLRYYPRTYDVYEEPVEIASAEEEKTVEIPIDFSSLKEKNSEVYAWIRIPDTQVDYPILQRASDDLYYLDHTIDGAEGLPGSIYTQSLNAQDFSDKNTVIYGHNMRDETMFGGLKSYMDESYMKAHSQILIYTPEHILTYQVFAAVTYDNRHILNSFDFESEEGFQEYLDSLKEVRNMSSYIDSDVEVTTEDKIITLSTCNGNSDQRFLVEAVLVNEE